jgi:peptide-methionine (S)-S-oxide reductase
MKAARTIVVAILLSCVIWSNLGLAEDLPLKEQIKLKNSMEQITLAGGCFWCMEAVFQSFRGVENVESGFAGGHTDNPHYEDVVNGDTGHAESVRITFNPEIISPKQILTIFFHAHDPTTKDRQGNDVGSQYRSLILYSSEEQRLAAEQVKSEIVESRLWGDRSIVTEIVPLKAFYRAEDYHQNYYRNNANRPYCLLVVGPKVQKIKSEFKDLLKK